MPYRWRLARPALLILLSVALVVPATLTTAQDDAPGAIVIQGTPELESLVGAIRDAYQAANPEADVTLDPSVGQRGAFEGLCGGTTDIVMSTAPISDEQIATCATAGQEFIETVLAYEAVVFLATPSAETACVAQSALDTAWQLGAPDDVLWGALGSQVIDTRAEFVGPLETDPAYLLLEKLVPAEALRANIEKTDELANILARLDAEDSNAIGFMSLAQLNAIDLDGAHTPLQVRGEDGICIAPSLDNLRDSLYPYARTAYLYVNEASAAREDVQAFVSFALTDEAGVPALGLAGGYTVPDDDTLAKGVANVSTNGTGRTFTRPLTPVEIVPGQTGTVRVAGSALLYDTMNAIMSAFTRQFPNATVEDDLFGNTGGWAAFCGGTADVLLATRAATDDEMALCTAAGIQPYTLDLGYQAVVFAVPQGNDWAECLNASQVAALLRAGTDEAPAAASWSDVDAGYPERALLLVAPPLNSGEADYITQRLIAPSQDETLVFAVRLDMVERADALYRWQGVANTTSDETNPSNGITYAWWSDVQKSEADVKLVSIDAGEGCIAPSPETFADGSYALSHPVKIHVSQASFVNPLVQAFLWNLYSDDSIDQFARMAFEGLDADLLRGDAKDAVFMLLDEWTPPVSIGAESGDAGADATPDATEEAAPDATAEATAEATEEPAADATAEATPEATATSGS